RCPRRTGASRNAGRGVGNRGGQGRMTFQGQAESHREVSMNYGTTIPVAPAKSRRFPVVAAIVLAGLASTASAQQQARQPPARFEPAAPAKDYDQRALEIYEFRKAAQSGPARGKEIYFYKCWMCHNELAQGGAPKLVGL